MSNQFVNAFVRQMGREYAHDIYRSSKEQSQVVDGTPDSTYRGEVIKEGPNKGKFVYDGLITRPFILWVLDIILLCIPYTGIFYAPIMLYKAIRGAMAKEVCFFSYGTIPQYVSDGRYKFGRRYIGEKWGKIPFLKSYEDADNSLHNGIYDKVKGKFIQKHTPTKIAKWFWGGRIAISSVFFAVYDIAFLIFMIAGK